MSKSGLYAHFGSKEELQLAAIDAAEQIFADAVIRPAREPEDPYERLESLCEHFFRYLEKPVFPGGCFFASAAAELDTHPGPVKERLAQSLGGWMELLERRVREAQEAGELDSAEDPAQLAFELEAFMKMANSHTVLHGGDSGFATARRSGEGAARARTRDKAVTIPPHAPCCRSRQRAPWSGCTVSSPRQRSRGSSARSS